LAGLRLANLQVGSVDPRVVMQVVGLSQPSTIMRCLGTPWISVPGRTIHVAKRRLGLLNLVLRGIAGGGTFHIVPIYGPLPADHEDNQYWGEHSLASCGRKVRIRIAPTNMPSSAAEVAERLNYMPVETWRKDDLAQTCRQCLDRLDPDLRALLGLDESVAQVGK